VFIFVVLSGIGGLATLLLWLGIGPTDFAKGAKMTGNALWLVSALVLFAVNTWLSWRSFLATRKDKEIWSLKKGAREIMRRWPNFSKFRQNPTNRRAWSPEPGERTSIGQEAAISWHNRFLDHMSGRAPSSRPDFDGLMELLDREERSKRSLKS
jgi:hypothetical protein